MHETSVDSVVNHNRIVDQIIGENIYIIETSGFVDQIIEEI